MDLNALAHIRLAQPQWLWLLLPVILAWLAVRIRPRQRDTGGGTVPGHSPSPWGRFRHPSLSLLAEALAQGPLGRDRGRSVWQLILMALLLLALAQPQHIGAQLPEPAQRRNLVFIVDNSVAMNLRDYVFDGQRVARLTVLKGVLHRFVERLRGDRISLVLYADRAYTLVPLTYDHDLVHALLGRLDTGLAGRSNAVGDAVALAVKEADAASGQRRVLVLFSSAARPTGTVAPLDAARLAARRGLRLYTVAVGAGSEAAAEQRDTGLIYDPTDLARLQTMAAISGGEAFVAGDTGQLQTAIETIGRLETDAGAVEPRYRLQPLYQWPLLAGLLILTVAQMGALLRAQP